MSLLVIVCGVLEWIDVGSEVSGIKIHHGVTGIGVTMFIDGADKIYSSYKTIKTQLRK